MKDTRRQALVAVISLIGLIGLLVKAGLAAPAALEADSHRGAGGTVAHTIHRCSSTTANWACTVTPVRTAAS